MRAPRAPAAGSMHTAPRAPPSAARPARPAAPSAQPRSPRPVCRRRRCDCPRHRGGEQCEKELDVEAVCRRHAIRREDCRAESAKLCVNGCNARGACIGGFCHCQPGGRRGAARRGLGWLARGRGAPGRSVRASQLLTRAALRLRRRRQLGHGLRAVVWRGGSGAGAGGHWLQDRRHQAPHLHLRAAAALQRLVGRLGSAGAARPIARPAPLPGPRDRPWEAAGGSCRGAAAPPAGVSPPAQPTPRRPAPAAGGTRTSWTARTSSSSGSGC